MKFLVAIDGSGAADNALEYATDLADGLDAAVTVVHSVDPAVYQTGGSDPISTLSDADRRLLVESVEEAEERGLDVLEDAVELAAERGRDAGSELLYGDPVATVPEYAANEGFDAIFVGHRGRDERADVVLGSVAKQIVERATVPVTVVR